MQPIILIHGLIGAFADERAVSVLRPAQVLSPDLLGYGVHADVDSASITIPAQAEHLHAVLARQVPTGKVHLVGHSVGAVTAMAFAHRFADRVASVVSVEGNFTLKDAFWSAQVAAKSVAEVDALLEADRADPARWLQQAGITPTGEHVAAAVQALAYQPGITVRATARAVVAYTSNRDYEPMLRSLFVSMPVHLVAGGRSRAGWDVPAWALQAAASYSELPQVGHMVMLEAPQVFAEVLVSILQQDRTGSAVMRQ
jgi:pimeloyl-ACP methyl ester carboxylesterase